MQTSPWHYRSAYSLRQNFKNSLKIQIVEFHKTHHLNWATSCDTYHQTYPRMDWDIHPKNIPAKFQKDLKNISPSYHADKLGHMDGWMDRQTDRGKDRQIDTADDNTPSASGPRGKMDLYHIWWLVPLTWLTHSPQHTTVGIPSQTLFMLSYIGEWTKLILVPAT